jgi:hypothetical protein
LSGARLSNPRIFGHWTGVCASQDRWWREYSTTSPKGGCMRVSLAPLYRYTNCCEKP